MFNNNQHVTTTKKRNDSRLSHNNERRIHKQQSTIGTIRPDSRNSRTPERDKVSENKEKEHSPEKTLVSSSFSLRDKQSKAGDIKRELALREGFLKSVETRILNLLEAQGDPSLSSVKRKEMEKWIVKSEEELASLKAKITELSDQLFTLEDEIEAEAAKLKSEDERKDQSNTSRIRILSDPVGEYLQYLMKCVTTQGMGFYARIVNSKTEYKRPFDTNGKLLPREKLEEMGYVYIDGNTMKLTKIDVDESLFRIPKLDPMDHYERYFRARGLLLGKLRQLFDDPAFKDDPDAMIEIRLPFDLTCPCRQTYFGGIPIAEPLFIRKRDWELLRPYLVLDQQSQLPDSLAIFGHPGIGKSAFLNFLLILSLCSGYIVRVEKWTDNNKSGYVLDPQSQTVAFFKWIEACNNQRAHISLEDPVKSNIRSEHKNCFKVFATPPNKAFFHNLDQSIFANRIPIAIPTDPQLITMMHLANGKSREEVKKAAVYLSPSLRYLNAACKSEYHNDYIRRHIETCKDVMRSVLSKGTVESVVDVLHKVSQYASSVICQTIPYLYHGSAEDTSPEAIAMASNTYPRFLFTGHPGYVVRPDDEASKHKLFVGSGNPIIGNIILSMILDKFRDKITQKVMDKLMEYGTRLEACLSESNCMMTLQSGVRLKLQLVKPSLGDDGKGNDMDRDVTLFSGDDDLFPRLLGSVQTIALQPTPGPRTASEEMIMLLGESYYSSLVIVIKHPSGDNYFLLHPPVTGASESHSNIGMMLVIKYTLGPDDDQGLGIKLMGFQVTVSDKHDFNTSLQVAIIAYVTYRLRNPLEPELEAKFKDYYLAQLRAEKNEQSKQEKSKDSKVNEAVEGMAQGAEEGQVTKTHVLLEDSVKKILGINDTEEQKLADYRVSLWEWVKDRCSKTVDTNGGVKDWNKASSGYLPFSLCAWSKAKEMTWNVIAPEDGKGSTKPHIPYYHVPLDRQFQDELKLVKDLSTKFKEIEAKFLQ